MATLNFAGTDRKVFTPIPGSVSSGIAGLSSAPGTLIALVQMTLVGNADIFGLTDAATANWYHDLQWAGGLNDTLFDDDGVVGTNSGSMTAQDTTNWFWLAVDWPSTAAAPRFHLRNHTTGGAWAHAPGGAGPAARNGPGTGGWLRVGAAGDHSAGSRNIALAAVWAGTRFVDTDYGIWTKTSDLYGHAKGAPSFLCELTATTLVDLIGGSTYSSGNSSGTTLTGGNPPSFTFDGVGSAVAPSDTSRLLTMLRRGGRDRAVAIELLHRTVPVAAPGSLDLDASAGTAAASGSNAALSFSYTAGGGAATAGGSNVVFSDGLTAASGAATAGGGSVTLAATWAVTSGGATAGGGSDTLAVTWSAAGGAATAGGGADTGAFTFSAASGAATAGGGGDALTFVFGVSGGGATAGGGSVTESATTGADVSASGGLATAVGGAVSFAVTLTAGAGGAQASGGTVSVSVDVTPPVVVEPPSVGPTGGADFDFGDESAIYGTSARVVSTRGRGHGWGSVAFVRVSSALPPLRIRLPRPRPAAPVVSARVESARGAGAGYGAVASSSSTARAVSVRGAADGWGAAGRVLAMDGDPEADDLLAMTLLGML